MYLQTYLTRQECVFNNLFETPAGKLLIGNLECHFVSSYDSRNRCVSWVLRTVIWSTK